MICNNCKKVIRIDGKDGLIREPRTGYEVSNWVEDYYCPHCGEDVYPTYRDWAMMSIAEWEMDEQTRKHLESQRLHEQETLTQIFNEDEE